MQSERFYQALKVGGPQAWCSRGRLRRQNAVLPQVPSVCKPHAKGPMHQPPPLRPGRPLQGHGGTARLVLLPHESHGYSARESVMHTLYEVRTACRALLRAQMHHRVQAAGQRRMPAPARLTGRAAASARAFSACSHMLASWLVLSSTACHLPWLSCTPSLPAIVPVPSPAASCYRRWTVG